MSDTPDWHIVGEWFDNCSCTVACPCTFGQAPDNNLCETVLFWVVRTGHYGDVVLDGLTIVRVGQFEGNLWTAEANGHFGTFIDERATEAQADAMGKIFGGQVGGFPEKLASNYTAGRKSAGTERARISFEIAPDQSRWGLDIAGKVKAWAKALVGPTSNPGDYPRMTSAPGSETGPGQVVTWGKSTICKVDAFGFNFDWTINSAKHITFDWSGP